MNINQLQNLALFTDNLFKEYKSDIAGRKYPNGCCGITSDLLGAALFSEGYTYVKKIYQGRIGDFSHAWLDFRGIIIDITYYQFECNKAKSPYVGNVTEWHESFIDKRKRIIDPKEEIAHWEKIKFENASIVVKNIQVFIKTIIKKTKEE